MNTCDYEGTYIKYREFLLNEIMAIDSMFDLYLHIYNKQSDEVEVLNVAPAFFRMTMKAFLENSMICLSKLYDNDTNTITINKFLNFIQTNIKWLNFSVKDIEVQEKIDSIKDLLLKNENNIKKLKTIRDSFLAHNDRNYIFDDPWEKTELTIGQIHELINLPSHIINEIGVLKGEPYVFKKAINALDVDVIFQIISDYLHSLKIDNM